MKKPDLAMPHSMYWFEASLDSGLRAAAVPMPLLLGAMDAARRNGDANSVRAAFCLQEFLLHEVTEAARCWCWFLDLDPLSHPDLADGISAALQSVLMQRTGLKQ